MECMPKMQCLRIRVSLSACVLHVVINGKADAGEKVKYE